MTALPTAIGELLNHTAPFDQLSSDMKLKIGKKSAWVYIAKDNKEEFVAQHSNDVCVIHSGQFVVDDNYSGIKHLSEGDIFGYSQHIRKKTFTLQIEIDLAGLVLCIEPELFDQLMEIESVANFFKREDASADTPAIDAQSMWMHRSLAETQNKAPICIDVSETIYAASLRMNEANVSSILVTENRLLVGIVTDRDLRNRVLAKQRDPAEKITSVMTTQPAKVRQDKSVFDAMCTMNERGIHHLPIVDLDNITPVGIITATDVIRLQRGSVLFLVSELSKAKNLHELSNISWQIPHYFSSNAKRPSDFDIAGKVLSQSTDIMTRKLIGFFAQEHGAPPLKYAWLVYGSQAREDQTLGSDQDNALLLESEPDDSQAAYFSDMATYVCEGLNKCGIKSCPGNIMASNPALRVPLNEAIKEAKKWVIEPNPQALLELSIYLDVRHIAGDRSLANALSDARSPILKKTHFIAALARQTNDVTVPLSLFNRFVYTQYGDHEHCIDVKTQAVAIINSIVRNYALSAGLKEPNTLERLKVLPDVSPMSSHAAANLRDIWMFLNRLRWRHQVENNVTDNYIRVDTLSSIEKHQLKRAFKTIEQSQESVLHHFSGGMR